MEHVPSTADGKESFASASVNLEIDDGASQLSYYPQAEITSDIKQISWQQEFMKWGIRADIKNICQGHHDSNVLACLVVFRFVLSLDSTSGWGRISEAKINIKAEPIPNDPCADVRILRDEDNSSPVPAGTDNDSSNEPFWQKIWRSVTFGSKPLGMNAKKATPATHYPHVAVICPKNIYGEASLAHISNTIGGNGGPEYARLSANRSISRDQRHMIRARGQRWLDMETGSINIARWVITENSSQGSGIPMDFACAALYEHGGEPFQLTVEVRLRTKTGLTLFGHPWSALTPVMIRPGTKFGSTTIATDFNELSIQDWRCLCPAEWSDADEVSFCFEGS